MDKFTLTVMLLAGLVLTVSLVLNVDVRAALLKPFGIQPLFAEHPGPEIFELDLEKAGLYELGVRYETLQKRIQNESPFPQLDRPRLDLAYARALCKLTEQYVARTLN